MSVNMISEMMNNIIIEQPKTKGSQKTLYEKAHGKYIHKTPNSTYTICKSINGQMKAFGTYKTFQEACDIRDKLIERNWEPLPKTEEYYQKEYYKNIGKSGERYKVRWCDGYRGTVDTIEEALYFRDIVQATRGECEKPEEYDLHTNNPYLKGLKYPIPERLIIIPKKSDYGKGYIMAKGPQSYHLWYGDKYYCACRTYEQAYYVKQEMNKVDWDTDKLDEILDNYPVWYTWLMNFWQYVNPHPDGKRWLVTITPKNNPDNALEKLMFSKVEDALWERDLLLKYDYDEELLVEAADDSLNPYYNMIIPPYPQRKVRRIVEREPRTQLFNTMKECLLDGCVNQEEIAKACGTTPATIRGILRREYDSTWKEFLAIVARGEDPNQVLEQKPIIYKPNLDYIPPNNNYVQLNKTNRKSCYTVSHKGEYFGSYLTRELANKISNDMQKIGWDKSRLEEIQLKHGHTSIVGSKRWIYANQYTSKKTGETRTMSYAVRKKDKQRRIHNYGSYKDYEVAARVRDLLMEHDWEDESLPGIIEQVKKEFGLEEL